MAKVTFDLESNAQPVIDDWNRLNQTGEELNKTTEEFGDVSKKSFSEASDAASDFGKTISDNDDKEKKGIKTVDELKKALNELAAARDKSQDPKKIVEFNKKIEQAEKSVKQLTNVGKEGFDEMGESIEDAGGRFDGLLDIAAGFGIALGAEAIIGGIIEIGGAVVETIGQFRTLRGEVEQLTGLTGELLDKQVEGATAIGETYDVDVLEVIQAANVLSNEFGITQEEALEKVKAATLGVAGDTGELIEQTKEYASQIAAAGGDADNLFQIINQSTEAGVFSDKGVDVVKEFGLRIREQATGTQEALENAFGTSFTEKLFKGIDDGSITSVEALEQISQKLNDTEIPASELQTVIADVFGGAGEDAGLKYLQSLTDISGSVEGLIDETNALTREQLASLEAEERLAEAQNNLSKLFDDDAGSTFFTNLKATGFDLLTGFLEPFLELWATLKESFGPLVEALGELKTEVFGASEGFSFLDSSLLPLKVTFKAIGFLIEIISDALTFVVSALREFIQSTPAVQAAFSLIGDAISDSIEQLKVFRDIVVSGFDLAAAAAKTAARNIDENFTKPMLEQVSTLDKAQRDRVKRRIIDNQLEIKSNLEVLKSQGLLTSAAGQQLIEGAKANKAILDQIAEQESAELSAIEEAEKEKQIVRDKANDDAAKKAKADADKRLKALQKLQDDLLKAIERLAKESDKIEFDRLEGPERFAKIKENSFKEIQILEDAILEKGKLFEEEKARDEAIRAGKSQEEIDALVEQAGEAFDLTAQQQEQLRILRDAARQKELESIAKFNSDRLLAQIKGGQESLDIQEQFALNSVEQLENNGMTEQDFLLFQEEEKLRIQQEFTEERIKLLNKELDERIKLAEADGVISIEEQNAIDKLELQKENLQNTVTDLKNGQDELAKQRSKVSIAELLGLSDDELDALKGALSEVSDAVIGGLQNLLAEQQAAAEERFASLEEQEQEAQAAIDRELELNEAGFASNVDAKREELAQIKAAKEIAAKEAEEAAKKQFLLDTALQAQGLITSSINIIEGFTKAFPVIGLGLGIASVATMFAFFATARAKAFQAISSPQAATGASGSGKTGRVHGSRHYQGGENFTDHLEVETGEDWGILSRGASKKHGKTFHQFTEGLNAGKSPTELMDDLLHGTGVYMKRGIDKKIVARGVEVRHQEIITMANAQDAGIAESVDNMDKNLSSLLGLTEGKKEYIKTNQGYLVIDPVTNKKTHIIDTSNGTD